MEPRKRQRRFMYSCGGADDDDAVRKTLEALTSKGYVEAELDQIGVMDGEPEDPTYEAAYEDALSGNVAVIAFAE